MIWFFFRFSVCVRGSTQVFRALFRGSQLLKQVEAPRATDLVEANLGGLGGQLDGFQQLTVAVRTNMAVKRWLGVPSFQVKHCGFIASFLVDFARQAMGLDPGGSLECTQNPKHLPALIAQREQLKCGYNHGSAEC
jgi:hypothetical protein